MRITFSTDLTSQVHTVNWKMFVSTKFQFCNFLVQILSDISGPAVKFVDYNLHVHVLFLRTEENCVFEVTI